MEADEFAVIVGWSHAPLSQGIQLKVQASRAEGPAQGTIDTHRFLMSRNQALILAKYLLDATGQSLPEQRRAGPIWGPIRRALRRLTGG